MVYVAVNEDGTEVLITETVGKRGENCWYYGYGYEESPVELPKGSIKKLIGKELTWEDEPVELVEHKQPICRLCEQPFTPTEIWFNGNCENCNKVWKS